MTAVHGDTCIVLFASGLNSISSNKQTNIILRLVRVGDIFVSRISGWFLRIKLYFLMVPKRTRGSGLLNQQNLFNMTKVAWSVKEQLGQWINAHWICWCRISHGLLSPGISVWQCGVVARLI